MSRFFFLLLFFGGFACLYSQKLQPEKKKKDLLSTLTVKKIMRHPNWIGVSPSQISWSEDSQKVYFWWNAEGEESRSLYWISKAGGNAPKKVLREERLKRTQIQDARYNRSFTKKVYERNGDLFLLDITCGETRQITNTVAMESKPRFSFKETKILFLREQNLFSWNISNGEVVQLTNFIKNKTEENPKKSKQKKWLEKEEFSLFQVLKERERKRKQKERRDKREKPRRPKEIYLKGRTLDSIQLSPDESYITFQLEKKPTGSFQTQVPSYVDVSGFTQELSARSKVGFPQRTYEFGIYHRKTREVHFVKTEQILGINESPAYLEKKETKELREVLFHGPYWSDNGQRAVVILLSLDNKDRWIMLLDPVTGQLNLLDRQHDEAWIGGPGIIGWGMPGSFGWLPPPEGAVDSQQIWFQSEETGYSHLYVMDVVTKKKQQRTSGAFEVSKVRLSRNKKYWYFTSNEVHPGERHFYRMPVDGGIPIQITSLPGNHKVELSPDETTLAIRYSYSNQPWELYLMKNEPLAKPQKITNSLSKEFLAYPWRDPELITFRARDGAQVYGRLFRPKVNVSGGPAVVFVHGAGYLQNAHRWWSSYFREYMFHNLLADHGYTVLDIDYRGSSGYGREWRTGIYRYMGNLDLTDQIDGVGFLCEKYKIDPKRVGIYGGSYGGFIVLMAMFTQPEVFAAGAALRPVTDWAHYNHGYTSNILNVPVLDPKAYRRSSPIYHAEGLQGSLLICHGMIDTNVHFQDVVRLTQRLIELEKENWELAAYPLEGHGFREPTSWTDEYRRIFKLFEKTLK